MAKSHKRYTKYTTTNPENLDVISNKYEITTAEQDITAKNPYLNEYPDTFITPTKKHLKTHIIHTPILHKLAEITSV